MSRARLFLGALALVGACTSQGTSPVERLLPQIEDTLFGGSVLSDPQQVPEVVELTRAQLDQIPFATISVGIEDGGRAYVVAVSDTNGNVVYQDQSRRSLVFRGGLVVATEGLGYNLSAVKHQQGSDPVAEPRTLSEWPVLITRNYQFALRGTDDFQITVRCRYAPAVRETIEIVELTFEVARIEETCGNGARQFTNTYWVDSQTGFIWRSHQWIGPRQPHYLIEVIRPYRT